MTKVNHRINSTARRTHQAYEAAAKSELAYLDAVTGIQIEKLRYGKQGTLAEFIYELPAKRDSRNGGSR